MTRRAVLQQACDAVVQLDSRFAVHPDGDRLARYRGRLRPAGQDGTLKTNDTILPSCSDHSVAGQSGDLRCNFFASHSREIAACEDRRRNQSDVVHHPDPLPGGFDRRSVVACVWNFAAGIPSRGRYGAGLDGIFDVAGKFVTHIRWRF